MCSTPQPRTVYDPIDAAGPAGLSFVAADLTTIEDVSKTLLDQVEAFFVSYNEQRGKKFRVIGNGRSDEGNQVPQNCSPGASVCPSNKVAQPNTKANAKMG